VLRERNSYVTMAEGASGNRNVDDGDDELEYDGDAVADAADSGLKLSAKPRLDVMKSSLLCGNAEAIMGVAVW